MTVREKIGPLTKRRALDLEEAARQLELRAHSTPLSDPATAYALQAVANVFRLKALYLRQVPGSKLSRMIERELQAAKVEFSVSIVD